jgi:hypothetical protein
MIFIWSGARATLLNGVKERQKVHQALNGTGRRHGHII